MQYSEINSWNLFSLKETKVLSIPTMTGTIITFCNVLFNNDASAILQFTSALPQQAQGNATCWEQHTIQFIISVSYFLCSYPNSSYLICLLETTGLVRESLHWACHCVLSIPLLCSKVHSLSFFVGPWELLDHSGFTLDCSTRYTWIPTKYF